jgi:hypothetical protein
VPEESISALGQQFDFAPLSPSPMETDGQYINFRPLSPSPSPPLSPFSSPSPSPFPNSIDYEEPSDSNDEIQETESSDREESGVPISNLNFETVEVDEERAIRAVFVNEENLEYENSQTDIPDEVSAEINLVGSTCGALEIETEEKENAESFSFPTSTLNLPGMPAEFRAALLSAMRVFASPLITFFNFISTVTQLLVLVWFTTFNATYRSGNAICGLLHILFSFIGLWFPRTIDQCIALTTFATRINTIQYFIMCPKCATPCKEEDCWIIDPRDPTGKKRISRTCSTIIFPQGRTRTPCGAILLQTIRTSAGKYTLRPLPSQKLIYPGTGDKCE